MEKSTGMILAHAGEEYDQYYNAIVPPIFMNSLNIFPTVDAYYDSDKRDRHTYCYGRVQNPTVRILEEKINELEKGAETYVFSSGMAAATAAVLSACKSGGHVVCVRTAYGPLKDFLQNYCREHMNIRTTLIDGDDPMEMEEALTEETQLLVLESPSSVVFHVQDIERAAEAAHKKGALVYIDNTFCTPIYQNPIEMGADFVMHTASKYLGGTQRSHWWFPDGERSGTWEESTNHAGTAWQYYRTDGRVADDAGAPDTGSPGEGTCKNGVGNSTVPRRTYESKKGILHRTCLSSTT